MNKKSNIKERDKVLINKAIKLNNEQKHKEALEILLEQNSTYPESSTINGLIATTYHYLNDVRNAIRYFTTTITLNPDSEMASLGLFHEFWKIEEYKKAINELDRFLTSHNPDNYKITLIEMYDQICEETPKYQSDVIKKHYHNYIASSSSTSM